MKLVKALFVVLLISYVFIDDLAKIDNFMVEAKI